MTTHVSLAIQHLRLPTNLLLAPIAGYCDVSFRLVARSCGGVGLACTDLLCPEGVLRETRRSMELAASCPEDSPLCMQLYGGGVERLCEAARWAEDRGAADPRHRQRRRADAAGRAAHDRRDRLRRCDDRARRAVGAVDLPRHLELPDDRHDPRAADDPAEVPAHARPLPQPVYVPQRAGGGLRVPQAGELVRQADAPLPDAQAGNALDRVAG